MRDDLATVNARAGANFDNVIGRADGVFVVFDNDDCVAQMLQSPQRFDHLDVVFGVQADAGFVQHIQHAHQAGTDLRREPNAL